VRLDLICLFFLLQCRKYSTFMSTASRAIASRSLATSTTATLSQPVKHAWRTHVLSSTQFDRAAVENVLTLAGQMEAAVRSPRGGTDLLQGKVLVAAFFEPSTRTQGSFNAAMLRMGGTVVNINSETSSAKKGETLEDTIRVLEKYGDAIAMRHPMTGAALLASEYASRPILNAGDGAGEHPTQALLDLYTMKKELGKLDGLTVTLLGDLKHGRTVHSLANLLSLFKVKINYVSPSVLRMPAAQVAELKARGVEQHECEDIKQVLAETDILYVTRIQKERFTDLKQYDQVKGAYVIDKALMKGAKKHMAVMHPLPRVDEISTDFDSDPRAAYFRQVEYGMFTRMALLGGVMGKL
jgi:aspartate carbamoyltransferase